MKKITIVVITIFVLWLFALTGKEKEVSSDRHKQIKYQLSAPS